MQEASTMLPGAFEFLPGACINSARITVDVLRHYGIRASAVPARLDIYNPVWVRLIKDEGLPKSNEALQRWTEAGASCVGVNGTGVKSATGWDGHLMVRLDDSLIDPSFGQFNRPWKAIPCPPVVRLPLPNGGKDFDRGELVGFNLSNGAAVTIQRIKDRSYRKFLGFQRHHGNRTIARRLIERIDKRLTLQEAA